VPAQEKAASGVHAGHSQESSSRLITGALGELYFQAESAVDFGDRLTFTARFVDDGIARVWAVLRRRLEEPIDPRNREITAAGAPPKPTPASGDGVTARFGVFADHHQFYVWDVEHEAEEPEFTSQALQDRVIALAQQLIVQPVRNVTVPVELAVYDADPGCDLDRWQHVVTCSLTLPTGQLQVHECTGYAVHDQRVEPGPWQARVLFRGLDTVSRSGSEGGDLYRIELWPGPLRPLLVEKHFTGR
jgi:hypothetical protein